MAPNRVARLLMLVSALVVGLLVTLPAHAATGTTPYISFRKFTVGTDFKGTARTGIAVNDQDPGVANVRLDPASARPGADKKTYGVKSYWYGTLESKVSDAVIPFDTAIPSWNAVTPAGTWLQLELRAFRPGDGQWTKYYNLGVWASGNGTIERHSVSGQGDLDGTVATDTLLLKGAAAYTQYQYRLTLFSTVKTVSPSVSLISVMTSDSAREPAGLTQPATRAGLGVELNVPQRSQMIYKGGGEVWCSPTSTSMVMAYWGYSVPVPTAAALTYDAVYGGTGNWPFNTAFAGIAPGIGTGPSAAGLEAYVTRMSSMDQVQQWIAAGVPVVMSYAKGAGDSLPTPYTSTSGHLMVIRGFTATGDVIVNDPAFGSDATVRAVYNRATLERLWLTHSGGTVYLIYPRGHAIPTALASGSW